MSIIKRFFKAIRPEEWLAVLVFVAVTIINVFVYQNYITAGEAAKYLLNYFTFGDPFYGWFFVIIYGLALFEFYYGLGSLISNWLFKNQAPTKTTFIDLLKKLVAPIRLIVPIALVAIPMYQLLVNFSYELRFVGHDAWLISIEQKFLVGGALFTFLPMQFPTIEAAKLAYYAYLSLSFVLSGLLALLVIIKKIDLFRWLVGSIIFSFIFSYPLFYTVSCQDPYHAFVAKNRPVEISDRTATELAGYKPNALAAGMMQKIAMAETNTARDNTVPVSCFPSMHAVWAILIAYFLARLSKWTGLLSIPWMVLTLAGGIYLAQHYLVDYFVAIPIAIISIVAGDWLMSLKREPVTNNSNAS